MSHVNAICFHLLFFFRKRYSYESNRITTSLRKFIVMEKQHSKYLFWSNIYFLLFEKNDKYKTNKYIMQYPQLISVITDSKNIECAFPLNHLNYLASLFPINFPIFCNYDCSNSIKYFIVPNIQILILVLFRVTFVFFFLFFLHVYNVILSP